MGGDMRRSARVQLVMLGSAMGLAGCDTREPLHQQTYGSQQECQRDWGDPVDCGQNSYRGGYYYGGRYYGGLYLGLGGWGYPYCGYYSYYCGVGYPAYYGYYDPGYYGYDPNAYSYYQAPPASYGYPPPQQAQAYPQQAYPQQGYPQQGQPAQQSQPQASGTNSQTQNFYLIAFSDHTIQAATAYKVDGDQIHWITREGQEKQAPLSTVDVRFSQQINRDRGVNFQIP